MSTLKRRILRAGGWGVAKRLIKPIPIVGSVFAFALAGYEIRKKGLLPGAVHVGLDVTPVVGTAKGIVERFGATLSGCLREERVAKQLTQTQQVSMVLGGPEELRKFLSEQMRVWGAVAREQGIKAD